jgi:hypothetical protein
MKRALSPHAPTTILRSGKRLCVINGKVVNTDNLMDDHFEDYDDRYYASRRGRDEWFLDHWGAAEGSKRQRTVRITEMWPAVKNRRQARSRSPIKGRPDKRAKPAPELSLQADEVLEPSPPPQRSVSPTRPVFFTDSAPRVVECKPVTRRRSASEIELQSARLIARAIGDASGRERVAKRGCWMQEEDALLREAVAKLCTNTVPGSGKVPWSVLCEAVPGRTAKQCRERFVEHLDVNLNHDQIQGAEADFVYYLFGKHGHKWATVCEDLNGWRISKGYVGVRAVNMVKNFLMNKEHLFEVPGRVEARKEKTIEPRLEKIPVSSVEFFDGFPASPLRDQDVFEELQNIVDVHAIGEEDVEVGKIDKEWEVLIHGETLGSPMLIGERPRSGLDILAEVGQVADTAETIAETLPTRRVAGYYQQNDSPPRTCFTMRKMSVELSAGDAKPRRSLFASINKMINTPPSPEQEGLGKKKAKLAPGGVRRPNRAATLSEAVTASARVWVEAIPFAEE